MEARNRIGFMQATLLISTGVAADTLQAGVYLLALIPFVGWAIAPVLEIFVSMSAALIFAFWSLLNGTWSPLVFTQVKRRKRRPKKPAPIEMGDTGAIRNASIRQQGARSGGAGVRFLLYGGAALFEFVPLLNALPAWTLYAVSTVILVRREDARYNEETRAERASQ